MRGAAGWTACFESAIALAARKRKITLPADVAIDAEADLNLADGGYFLRARLNVSLHIDGVATRSCVTAVDSIGKSQITTIKAIGATMAAARFRRPGSTARSFNAVTASRARSCPLRRCLRATGIRRMPISTNQFRRLPDAAHE
jgi:hypothetical protein